MKCAIILKEKMHSYPNIVEKQEKLKKIFNSLAPFEKYEKIISFGRELPPLAPQHKIPENLVSGCQSRLYLHSELQNGLLFFEADSDALISKGLAALLIKIYNHESPDTVLTCPPQVLHEIGISASLSPTRSHGLQNLYLKMKQVALYFLTHA